MLLKDLISFHIIYLEDINQQNIFSLIKFWQQSSKDCMRKHIANFKAFLNHCIKSQIFDSSRYQALNFPNSTVNIRKTVVTDSDYKIFFSKTSDKDFKLYMVIFWETGCRPNEIVDLKKADIDFDKGIAKIYQNKTTNFKIVYLYESP